jgi:hypothetical protein
MNFASSQMPVDDILRRTLLTEWPRIRKVLLIFQWPVGHVRSDFLAVISSISESLILITSLSIYVE